MDVLGELRIADTELLLVMVVDSDHFVFFCFYFLEGSTQSQEGHASMSTLSLARRLLHAFLLFSMHIRRNRVMTVYLKKT